MIQAARLADRIPAQGGGTEAAAKLADIVMFAVTYPKSAEALQSAGDLSGKVVINISNPITEDFKALTIGHTTSAAEEVQKLVQRARW
jgi:8-hydroxy-5-deazaflavin:NADPH oxidoreductase